MDMAPTILKHLDVAIPADMQGKAFNTFETPSGGDHT
jgi:bisphosphoglycerate-independent phosphoglycerate mutase (AlkP superfamily)